MMKKKQVVRRMGGGPMKKQVVKKRGGGSMKPIAMNIGGGLISEHKRMAMGLPLESPMRRRVSRMSPGERKAKTGSTKKMKKQTANDRLDERLGMRDGKESTKSQSMKSRRDESRAMKRGGVAKKRGGGTMTPVKLNIGGSPSPGKLKAMTGETTKGKALMKLARQIKPTGRINTDDLERIRKMLNKKK